MFIILIHVQYHFLNPGPNRFVSACFFTAGGSLATPPLLDPPVVPVLPVVPETAGDVVLIGFDLAEGVRLIGFCLTGGVVLIGFGLDYALVLSPWLSPKSNWSFPLGVWFTAWVAPFAGDAVDCPVKKLVLTAGGFGFVGTVGASWAGFLVDYYLDTVLPVF